VFSDGQRRRENVRKIRKKRFEESAAHEFVDDRSGQTARTLNTPKSGPDYPQ